MLARVRANLLLLSSTLVISSVLYPLALLGIGRGLFPERAAGSLVLGQDGKPVGSRLIAQAFSGDEWFQPRPSPVDYNASASGGSNSSANNPALRDRAEAALKSRAETKAVPSDAVTGSGSGLDPHITLRNAKGQLDRVVSAWASKSNRDTAEIRGAAEEILAGASFRPLAGTIGGEDLVNVLEINLALDRRLSPR